MPEPTAQEQLGHMLAGFKHTYRVLAVDSVHRNWVWWLGGLTLLFLAVMAYISDMNARPQMSTTFTSNLTASAPDAFTEAPALE